MTLQHFLMMSDLSVHAIRDIIDLASDLKHGRAEDRASCLAGKTLGMIFEKPSTRTRLSFDVGMAQLGGRALYIQGNEIGIGSREPAKDVARVLSRFVDGVVIRANRHELIKEIAAYSTIPVINGLSDISHPCQALADALTISEAKGCLDGVKLTYIGDGNNVCVSLMSMSVLLGIDMTVSCPEGYMPSMDEFPSITFVHDPIQAVTGADVVYTDVWVSMGQEAERDRRLNAFSDYQVTSELLSHAHQDVVFMHCLPAHRGEEVTDEVMESSRSLVFDQAENRLHVQKAVLVNLLST